MRPADLTLHSVAAPFLPGSVGGEQLYSSWSEKGWLCACASGKEHAYHSHFHVSAEDKKAIMAIISRDARWFQEEGLMDYSLVRAPRLRLSAPVTWHPTLLDPST